MIIGKINILSMFTTR